MGKQFSYLKGTYEIYETSYYNEEGKLDGDFVQLFTFGQPHVTGHYTNGQKDGTWTKIAESGDTLSISTYRTGREEGLQVRFDRATGNRLKEYHTKNDRIREMGTYRNGHRTGRRKRYDINGKLEMEWEETQ